jgi:hypothetical protein
MQNHKARAKRRGWNRYRTQEGGRLAHVAVVPSRSPEDMQVPSSLRSPHTAAVAAAAFVAFGAIEIFGEGLKRSNRKMYGLYA